jgi:hypothetical protein
LNFTIEKKSKIFAISLSENGEIWPGKKKILVRIWNDLSWEFRSSA